MKSTFAAVTILLTAFAVGASAATWTVDPAHSTVQFSVKHMMVTPVHGSFNTFSGTVNFDPAKPSELSIDATIDASSIDTRVERRNNHLKSADFFDVAKFPNLTFKSKKTEVVSAGHYKVTGDLTMHGVTKEVVMDVEGLDQEVKDPMGGARTGAAATTTINREDFGLTWNKVMEAGGVVVSKEVKIAIDAELKKETEGTAK